MKNNYKKYIATFTTSAFLFTVLIALLIFNLYNSQNTDIKEDIKILAIEENNIIKRCGEDKEKFIFCSYPEFNFDSRIIWNENIGHFDNRCIKISFRDTKKYYLGIHLYLNLVFEPYLEKGMLEFWLKGKENYSLVKSVDLYLKEGPIIQRIAEASLPIKINKDWQKVSLPLNKFLLIRDDDNNDVKNKDKEFYWLIQEILFSVTPMVPNDSVELFIDDLRIRDNERVIYELF